MVTWEGRGKESFSILVLKQFAKLVNDWTDYRVPTECEAPCWVPDTWHGAALCPKECIGTTSVNKIIQVYSGRRSLPDVVLSELKLEG